MDVKLNLSPAADKHLLESERSIIANDAKALCGRCGIKAGEYSEIFSATIKEQVIQCAVHLKDEEHIIAWICLDSEDLSEFVSNDIRSVRDGQHRTKIK